MTSMLFDPSESVAEVEAPRPSGRRLTVFTNSEAQTFRDCRRKHWFAYVRGLRPKVAAKALTYGTAFHAGAEPFYRTIGTVPADECFELGLERAHKAMSKVFSEWLDALEESNVHIREDWYQEVVETVDMARWALTHYLTTFKNDITRLVPIAVEKPFAIHLRDNAGRLASHMEYMGVWDLVAWDPAYDDLVIHDHKTSSGPLDGIDRRVELDPQMGGYLYALNELLRSGGLADILRAKGIRLDPPTGRVVYNVSRKKKPSTPSINKDGTVSTAAIDTLPELYAAALANQGEPEWLLKARATAVNGGVKPLEKLDEQWNRWRELQAKQKGILEALESRGEAFVSRREFWRTPREIERWRQDAFAIGSDLRAAERDPRFRYANPGHCTNTWSLPCVYRSICLDDSPEIASNFRVEPRHAEVEAANKRDEEV